MTAPKTNTCEWALNLDLSYQWLGQDGNMSYIIPVTALKCPLEE